MLLLLYRLWALFKEGGPLYEACTGQLQPRRFGSRCGIYVNQHKNEVKTSVIYYVSDVEAVRKRVAENLKSDWWAWNRNQETWIQYDDQIGNKLIVDAAASGGKHFWSHKLPQTGAEYVETAP